PKSFLRRARLYFRKKSAARYDFVDVALHRAGHYDRCVLPPRAREGRRPEAMQLYLVAYDANGSEVLLWGEPTAPRDVAVGYRPPAPWYGRGWLWALAAAIAAVATGVAVFAATSEPPERVEGTFSVR